MGIAVSIMNTYDLLDRYEFRNRLNFVPYSNRMLESNL
jgi:hypothetical protein